jgi:para-aminobenzoate synthetase component 1
MKGTIDATILNAREVILADRKELAEHVTMVDLIRNDLSTVASSVKVTRFRYLEEVKTNRKNLFQVSSEIQGHLASDYASHLGDMIVSLLPAGSISGAPKAKTREIIQHIEGDKRGYYTGVVGYFDGNSLDTGVMIRYIEKTGEGLFFRSGGGITTQSTVEAEREEAIDKVYVPIH